MATGTVTASAGLNVRKGPGTGYSKLGALPYRTSIGITGQQQNGWYPVRYNGCTGYVCGSYLKVSGGTAGNAGGGSDSASGTYTVTATALNVRSGGGTNHKILGQVYNGQSLSVVGESNGWLKIQYKGGIGWVSKKYTKKGGSGGSTGGGSAQQAQAKTGKVTCNTLNVRSGAGTGNSRIGQLHYNDSFSYTGESSGWLKINYKGGIGWISKKYTTVGGGSLNGGGQTGGHAGGNAPKNAVALGQQALSTAINLFTRANNEGWKYDQGRRMRDGYYDCSAYSDRSWRGAGITMAANSEGQAKKCYNAGGEVGSGDLIAGDLLFYHNDWNSGPRWRGINHVAVYDGNGGRYDAGGTPIKHYTNWNNGNFVMAARPSVLA